CAATGTANKTSAMASTPHQRPHQRPIARAMPSLLAANLEWDADLAPASGRAHWRRTVCSCSTTAMVEGTPKPDGYIAVRRAELAQGIVAADGLPQGEAGAFGDVLKLLDALLQYEAHERLEALKTLYDPLDPDAPPTRRDVTPAALDAFEQAFVEALLRANFVEVDHDTVQTRDATKLLTGLSIKPSLAGIRRIRFFARGVRPEKVALRTWGGLGAREIEAEIMADVVVFVGF